MQDEVALTVTQLHNDPEQMAYFNQMIESFTWSLRKTRDNHRSGIVLLEQEGIWSRCTPSNLKTCPT
jgi:hypothetical protein